MKHLWLIGILLGMCFVWTGCGDDIELSEEGLCILSGGKWSNGSCACADSKGQTRNCDKGIVCLYMGEEGYQCAVSPDK